MADETTSPTNAEAPATLDAGNGDQNTNPPIRTFAQTQATNGVNELGLGIGIDVIDEETGLVSRLKRNPETGELYDPGGIPSLASDIDPGVGANDENPAPDTTSTQKAADVQGNVTAEQLVTPRPNILDEYANYTYSASFYLMNTDEYNKFMRSTKKTVNGYNLLFQSGGASNNVGGVGAPPAKQTFFENDGSASTTGYDAGRNPAFPLDFYIDSITLDNKAAGISTQAPHMVTDLKFTVIEPNGISLIDRLYEAVQDHCGRGDQATSYVAATYLMAIRFYGYTINGQPVQIGANSSATGTPTLLIEKFIPVMIKGIKFRVSNKLATYDFECKPVGQSVGNSTRRGTIPYDVELADVTVGKLLGTQKVVYNTDQQNVTDENQSDAETARLARQNTAAAPQNASAANSVKQSIRQGLMDAMNEYQQKLVKDGIYNKADRYFIKFAKNAKDIESAMVKPPGKEVNTKYTGMALATSQNPNNLNPDVLSIDNTVYRYNVTAGQQVVKVIDLAIRQSEYITKQQNRIFSAIDGTDEEPGSNKTTNVDWFQISMQAVQGEYDDARNDFVWDITFLINKVTLQCYISPYFPAPKFRGVHKSYPYWFTGENTAVLDYQADFNYLYTITMTGNTPKNSAAARIKQQQTASMRELPFYNYQSASGESRQGADGLVFDPSANMAEYLFSPGKDMAESKITIIGDPAWIMQGSLAGNVLPEEFSASPFLPDGSINMDSHQILFEISWQKPEDYNLETGLADPYGRTQSLTGNRQPIQSVVWMAQRVVSEFKQGKFTQTLYGRLYPYRKPDGKNAATKAKKGAATTDERGRQNAANDPRVKALQDSLSQDAARASAVVDGNSAISPPPLAEGNIENSGEFTPAPPGPKDSVGPANPAEPPTSGSGENVSSVSNNDEAEGRVTAQVFDDRPVTPQDMSWEA
jgi:hypothetical protein